MPPLHPGDLYGSFQNTGRNEIHDLYWCSCWKHHRFKGTIDESL